MADETSPRRLSPKHPLYYFPRWQVIPHYHGDLVGVLFLGAAILLVFAAPLYADRLADRISFIVLGAVVFVALAALTDPRSQLLIGVDLAAALSGSLLFGWWAVQGFETASRVASMLRVAAALLFILAFYFSLKTLRAMTSGMIGRMDDAPDFKESASEEIRSERERPIADQSADFDSYGEPIDDGLGRPPAEEDDSGGD